MFFMPFNNVSNWLDIFQWNISQILTITEIQPQDAGQYTCRVIDVRNDAVVYEDAAEVNVIRAYIRYLLSTICHFVFSYNLLLY